MEQILPERAKWVSRTLALFSAVYGLWVLFWLMIEYNYSLLPQALPVDLFYVCIRLLLCGLLFWLAFRAWKLSTSKDVWMLPLALSIIVYHGFNLAQITLVMLLDKYMDISMIESVFVFMLTNTAFFALLAAGLVYVFLKRFFYRFLGITEQINPTILRRGGRLYFLLLSYNFFKLFYGIEDLVTSRLIPDSMPRDIDYYVKESAFYLLWIALTACLYIIGVRLFVTKPLRAIQSETGQTSPEGLNNSSPG